MTIVNLTPHTLNVRNSDGETISFPPSGEVARVDAADAKAGTLDGFSVVRTTLGEVTGLPPFRKDTTYVVSGMVAAASPRADVVSPGNLIRDDKGRPVGCEGFRLSL